MAAKKPPVHITSSFAEALPLAVTSSKPVFYWDDQVKGFGVKVTTTGKKYVAETRVNTKTVRVTIDAHTVISAEAARKRAKVLLGEMHSQKNPNAQKRTEKNLGLTFNDICLDYLSNKELKPLTQRDYLKHMRNILAPWAAKPYLEITREMVVDTYRAAANRTAVNRLGEERALSGAQANQAFRFARAVFTFAKRFRGDDRMPLLRDNPIDVLSENRLWRRVNKRTNIIAKHQLKPFWEAVWQLKNDSHSQDRETIRDFLLLMIFTGLRLGEARDLKWTNIDLHGATLTISDPKNYQEHVLPFSDYLLDFFRRRQAQTGESEWVFPAARKQGVAPIIEFRKTIKSVCEMSGVQFTPHDLRRSFLTFTKDLPGKFGPYFSKRLANHKISDITADYIQINLEDLRKCMQEITDYILLHSGAKSTRIGILSPSAPPTPQKRRIRVSRPETIVVRIPT